MAKYEFEIQDLIKVTEEAETIHEARTKVVDRLNRGGYEFDEDGSAIVSDGKEIK